MFAARASRPRRALAEGERRAREDGLPGRLANVHGYTGCSCSIVKTLPMAGSRKPESQPVPRAGKVYICLRTTSAKISSLNRQRMDSVPARDPRAWAERQVEGRLSGLNGRMLQPRKPHTNSARSAPPPPSCTNESTDTRQPRQDDSRVVAQCEPLQDVAEDVSPMSAIYEMASSRKIASFPSIIGK